MTVLKVAINPGLIDKNIDGDTRRFVTGWNNAELTPAELADSINQGVAYCPQLAGDKRRKAANFLCSDVLSVDMDGARRVEEVLADDWVRGHLTVFYTTPNHTEERHRFRLVFAVGRTIESADEMVAATLSLALRLSGDRSVTDAARLFFGSRGSNPQVYDGLISADELQELIEEGKRSNQSDSYQGDRPATVVSRIPVEWKLPIKLADGTVQHFEALAIGTRVHCPFHHDEEPSAFILQSRGGTKGLRCSTCSKTFWPPGTSLPRYDFFGFDKTVKRVEAYYREHADDIGLLKLIADESVHEGLVKSNISIVSSRYLTLGELRPGITFVKSPKGSGKAEALSRLLQHTDRALLIGHRVALIGQSCKRLGLKSYLECNPGPIVEPRLGICLDSLQRLAWTTRNSQGKPIKQFNEFRTVVIDESEQVLAHFLGGTIPPESRWPIFKLFGRLLRQAERVVALDADLNWLSFEMISKLANEGGGSRFFKPDKEATTPYRPSHIYLNEHTSSRTIEVFPTEEQLFADIIQSLDDGKRIFVTSNSKTRIEQISALIDKCFEGKVRKIEVTSRTNTDPEVVELVANVRQQAPQYQAILTSPSMGTGVDIAFEEDAELFDVVFGVFHPLITTHFDCDQQLGRVRHPKAVKVWLTPRRYGFDTAREVISKEIQEHEAFTGLLLDYDERLQPIYHTDDSFLDLGALVISQQRASKNDLKRHFLGLKTAQGFEITEHPINSDEQSAGEQHLQAARLLGLERLIDLLTNARTLGYSEFNRIRDRLVEREDVTAADRWSFDKTRIELFYREKINAALIEHDDRGRMRSKVLAYERFLELQAVATKESSDFWKSMSKRAKYKLRLIPADSNLVPLLIHLLKLTPLYDGKSFLPDLKFSAIDLGDFAEEALRLKPIIENLTGASVRRDVKQKPIMLLGRLLELLGLSIAEADRKVANKKKVYYYTLSAGTLADMNVLVTHRKEHAAWRTVRQLYGMPDYGDFEVVYSTQDESAVV